LAKKEVLLENAQRLYVIEQMTIDEVARKVDVNERTIRRWKTEHNWDLRKEQYIKTKQMFHEELYNFARKLMVSIEYDMDNNEKVDPGRMFAFTKMLPLITKIKEYEDDVSKKGTEDTGSKELSPEFMKAINEAFLGIKSDEQ
jgi:Fe-S-cluster formation regulator IscX/YfhJ